MKRKLSALSLQYVTALKKHLKRGPRASLESARGLGRKAVAIGLETLELARMHAGAVATLTASSREDGITKRAEVFFAEAITPIEKTHRAARQSQVDLRRLNEKLGQRAEELAASNRQVQRGIDRRKVMKEDFEKSGKQHHECLEKSLQLQKILRQLTHRVLTAQEDERKKISHQLQDEIAQTLLAINVRLLSLKRIARRNTKGLKNEIARTQRLVLKSARSVRRFARELGSHHPGASDRSLIML